MLKTFLRSRYLRPLLTFAYLGQLVVIIFMARWVHVLHQNPLYTAIAGLVLVTSLVISFIIVPLVRVNAWNKVRLLNFAKLCAFALLLFLRIAYFPNVWLTFLAVLGFSVATLFTGPINISIIINGNRKNR